MRESLQDVVGQASRAGAVIARIRSYLKRQPVQPVSLDVNEVIREVVALAANDVRRHHVMMRTELAEGLPFVVGDRVGLEQVVLNLIRNGIEAMETTSASARDLVVQSSRNGSHEVLVAVRDAGSGLPAENLERIFVPIFTTKPNGMGMGLSLSRSIIESHGGTLWATPNEGRGTTFRFTLQAK
jgi:C4-dicarboxylate-specific signal transduction histidine kinase